MSVIKKCQEATKVLNELSEALCWTRRVGLWRTRSAAPRRTPLLLFYYYYYSTTTTATTCIVCVDSCVSVCTRVYMRVCIWESVRMSILIHVECYVCPKYSSF